MRRTWNSWTYYGSEAESERDEPFAADEADRRQDDLKPRSARSGGPVRGEPASAFEQSMAGALERAMDLSDVRNERVNRVKLAIESGTYQVSARKLAQKLVKNMLGEYR